MWVQRRVMLCNAAWIMRAITWRELYGCVLLQVVLNNIGSELILLAALFVLKTYKHYTESCLQSTSEISGTKWLKSYRNILVIRIGREHSIEENNLCCRSLKIKFSFCPKFVIFEGRLWCIPSYHIYSSSSRIHNIYILGILWCKLSWGMRQFAFCFRSKHRAANWRKHHIARFYFDVMATKVNHASYCAV